MNIKNIIIAGILLVSVAGCNEKKNKSTDADKSQFETDIDVEELKKARQMFSKLNYAVPPPVDLYIAILETNVKFNRELLNPTDNVNKYSTSVQKAVAFGIYASDLAYCSVYSQTKETYLYFSTAKIIASDLGFQEGYDLLTIERLEKNMNDNDSLFYIIDDAYWKAFNHLMKESRKDLLALIIFGGWLESIHIATNSVVNFETDKLLVQHISDQVYLLENLIGFITVNNETKKSDLNTILDDLNALQKTYEKVYTKDSIHLTLPVFNEITKKVEQLRLKYIHSSI